MRSATASRSNVHWMRCRPWALGARGYSPTTTCTARLLPRFKGGSYAPPVALGGPNPPPADLKIDVRHRYVTEEAIILEVTISATHTGPWRGLPATGRSISFPLCGIYTFDQEDRLVSEKIYYDRATVFKQLGVFREPTTALGRLLTAINHPLTIARAYGRKLVGR